MIEDPAARTRAILWCLYDVDHEMPLGLALGHLKVIEMLCDAEAQRLEREAAVDGVVKNHGVDAVPNIVRSIAADPLAQDLARKGNLRVLASHIKNSTGCDEAVAREAASSLASLHAVNDYNGPDQFGDVF